MSGQHNKKLPYLGCASGRPNACCGDKRYGCCNPSATRFSPAGPAELTGQWDIGCNGTCAGNLKKCVGKCGNTYCTMHGKCKPGESDVPFMTETFCQATHNFTPSAVGVGAGNMVQ
jgi:hypothetical protein